MTQELPPLPSAVVPPGYKLVPVNLTLDMLAAGRDALKAAKRVEVHVGFGAHAIRGDRLADAGDKIRAAWSAMLSTAPAAPVQPAPVDMVPLCPVCGMPVESTQALLLLRAYEAMLPAAPAALVQPANPDWHWDGVPPVGSTCLLWVKPSWATKGRPYYAVDTYGEQREAPVEWSSATIPIGDGWDSFEHDEVLAWSLLNENGPAHGIGSTGGGKK